MAGKPTGGRCFAVLVVIASLMGLATPVAAQEGPVLTVQQAVERSLGNEEFETVRAAKVREARGEESQAGAWPNPTFSFEREQTWEEEQIFAEDVLLLEQALPVWGVERLREEAARKERQAVEAENEAARLERRLETRLQFYETLRAQRELAVAREWRSRLQRAVETMETRREAAEASAYAVERLRHSLDMARVSLESARASLLEQNGELAALVGGPKGAGEVWELQGRLPPSSVPDLETLTGELDERADLAALEARQQEAARQREAASRKLLPRPSVVGGYKRLDAPESGSFHGFVVGLSLSLPLWNQYAGTERAAQSRMVQLDARRRLMAREAMARLASLHRSVQVRMKAAESFREEAIPRAKRLLERVESRQEADESTLFGVVDAYQTLHETRKQVIEKQWQARETMLELKRVAGGFR